MMGYKVKSTGLLVIFFFPLAFVEVVNSPNNIFSFVEKTRRRWVIRIVSCGDQSRPGDVGMMERHLEYVVFA